MTKLWTRSRARDLALILKKCESHQEFPPREIYREIGQAVRWGMDYWYHLLDREDNKRLSREIRRLVKEHASVFIWCDEPADLKDRMIRWASNFSEVKTAHFLAKIFQADSPSFEGALWEEDLINHLDKSAFRLARAVFDLFASGQEI